MSLNQHDHGSETSEEYGLLSSLAADLRRLAAYRDPVRPRRWAQAFSPSYACVVLYRLSAAAWARGWRLVARLFWQLNYSLTGADLAPVARLGPGLVVAFPPGVMVGGRAGRNLTIEGRGGFGGGLEERDIGAGPGLAWLGDDVHLCVGAMILGPQRVGDGAWIGPNCTVVQDLPACAQVWPREARVRQSASGER